MKNASVQTQLQNKKAAPAITPNSISVTECDRTELYSGSVVWAQGQSQPGSLARPVRTLIEHPSSMTHSSVPLAKQISEGIDPGGVRLSIGLEDANDLIRDLGRALAKV